MNHTLFGLVTAGAAALLFGGCGECDDIVNGWEYYDCTCAIVDQSRYGPDQTIHKTVCANPNSVQMTCSTACQEDAAFFAAAEGKGCGCPAPNPGGGDGYEVAGDKPNSCEARLERGDSRANIRFDGQEQSIPVGGDVTFTGGCQEGACPISFSRMSFSADDFSVTDRGNAVRVADVDILNLGDILGLQSNADFLIPRDGMKLIVNALVDGKHTATMFYPGDDLYGYYEPRTGSFGLSGIFESAVGYLELDMRGAATSRPPVANAGPAQTVTAGRAGTAIVTLNGTDSYDLDDDLADILWYEGSMYLGSGTKLDVSLGVGMHTVTARAIDKTSKWNDANTTVVVR